MTTLKDLSVALNNHSHHGLLSFLSSLDLFQFCVIYSKRLIHFTIELLNHKTQPFDKVLCSAFS